MKQLILLITFSTNALFLLSQTQSAQQKVLWKELSLCAGQFEKTGQVSDSDLQKFPVYRIKGQYYASLFGITQAGSNWNYLQQEGCIIGKQTGNIRTIKIPLEKLNTLSLAPFFSYIELPAKIYPYLDKAVKDTRADSVQHGINLPEAFTGKDVYIGVTDWGFDYTHPMFYDTLLQVSRIHAAWDQFKQSGNSPLSFSYGAEYTTPQALAAAGSDTSNIYSYNTHGTHVAGIAGGSGAGLAYRGIAFESEFLFCTFLVDAASVIDGFNWMQEKAQSDGKRLVINMSWGLYYMGTLDGNSLLSQAIGTLSTDGVVFVASAGNNGNVDFHIKKLFNNNGFQSKISFYDYAANTNMWGQSITMWGEQSNDFAVVLRVYGSTGTLLTESDTISTANISSYIDSILITGTDTISFNVAGEHQHPLNNRPNLRLRVKNTNSSLNIVLHSFAASGTVHYWNVAELTTGVGNWGMPLSAYGTNGVSGDSYYSIGEPTCSPDAISVGAHSSSYYSPNGTLVGGAIASFSSYGPLYTEDMKPDITAPGVNVASSISSFTDASYTQIASTNFNGVDYDFARFSGTSMSSPCVAGIVALMMDANPTLMPDQIKNIIKQTARLDQYTGTITAPGNTRWGMGKINAYAAVVLALNTLSLEEIQSDNWLLLYPNPATTNVSVLVPEGKTLLNFSIYSADGKKMGDFHDSQEIDCSKFPNGIYSVEAHYSDTSVRAKFVKN